jgi:hypothetical protein
MALYDFLRQIFVKKSEKPRKPRPQAGKSTREAADEALNEIFRKHRKN